MRVASGSRQRVVKDCTAETIVSQANMLGHGGVQTQ